MRTSCLFTSNFARHAKDPNAYSIAFSPPWWYKGKQYPLLSHTKQMAKDVKSGAISEQTYTAMYFDLLKERAVTAQRVLDDLGDGAILLCYESPKAFCHRHLVALWITQETGVVVRELALMQQEVLAW